MVVSIPRNMSKACKLYLQHNFDEANKIMDKISEPYHQKAAIEAQLSLFKWNFDSAINKCMEFLPYLNEWRSLNMLEASFAMITFSAVHTRKNEVMEYLQRLKLQFEAEKDERYKKLVIGHINKSLAYLNGEDDSSEKPLSDKLMSVEEAAELWGCKEIDTPESARKILALGYGKVIPTEYIKLYERYHNLSNLTEHICSNVIKTYLYLGNTAKISETVLEVYKYIWCPVEKNNSNANINSHL